MATVDPRGMEVFDVTIHDSQRKIRAMQSDIGMLKSQPANDVNKLLIQNYEIMIAMNTRLMGIASTILSGPKPGIDFGSMMGEVPKIRADMDDTTTGFLQMSVLVFSQLFDLSKQDKHGHVELVITKAQRQELIDQINISFGSILNNLKGKDSSWTVGAASVLRSDLEKKFTTVDDPIA